MRLLILLMLTIMCSPLNAQRLVGVFGKRVNTADTLFKGMNLPRKPISYSPNPRWIRNEVRYRASISGLSVFIQNSQRQAGGSLDYSGEKGYTDQKGNHYGYTIFFTRIVNENDYDVDVEIEFPADSFKVVRTPSAYVKVFLPTDTMRWGYENLYNYSADSLKPFFDKNFYKATTFKSIIKARSDVMFYTAELFRGGIDGIDHTAFIVDGENLIYEVNLVGQVDAIVIRSGKIRRRN